MIRKVAFAAIFLAVFLCLVVLIGFYLHNRTSRTPEPKWQHTADTIVFIMDRFRGETDCDYMPPLQIRGNGQVLRVYYEDGVRHVLEAKFSDREMEKTIEDFIQAGFFDNDTRFDSFPMEGDFVMLSLEENLTYWALLDENEAVKALAEQLISNIEERGEDYMPSEGMIEVYQIDHDLDESVHVADWPDEEFGYTLDEILNTRTILRGEELSFVWAIKNSDNQVMKSNGEFYRFCIRID
ncbi:MAG: hypothetical protein KJ063_25910 [Anaerolineae bacterium]|nr:hypothetical protein [Anaerolineae bacterium]